MFWKWIMKNEIDLDNQHNVVFVCVYVLDALNDTLIIDAIIDVQHKFSTYSFGKCIHEIDIDGLFQSYWYKWHYNFVAIILINLNGWI